MKKGWFLGVALAFAAAVPATAAVPKAAAIELHNLAGENLPRIDEYSETALYKYFSRSGQVRFADRTAVSEMLLRRRDRVVLFPSDPELAAAFGRDLGVDYVVTGNILDYASDGRVHRMTVEFLVIGVEEADFIMRKVYDTEYHEETPYKKHREMLDAIIENMAVDFDVHLAEAEGKRREVRARLEELRDQAERAAAEALAAAQAALAAQRGAEAAASQAQVSAGEAAAARDALVRWRHKLTARKNERILELPTEPAWVTLRIEEVRLVKANWGLGEGDAEFLLLVSAPRPSGNSSQYLYPDAGPIALGQGRRLPVADAGLSFHLSPGDGEIPVTLCGIDSDAQPGTFAALLGGALDAVARAAEAIARAKSKKLLVPKLLGLAIAHGGAALARFVEEADVIGEAEVLIDHRGGGLADGRKHTVLSDNGAIEFTYEVIVLQ